MDEFRPIEHSVLWSLALENNPLVVRDYLASHVANTIPATLLFEFMLASEFKAAQTLVDAGVSVDSMYGVMSLLGIAVVLRRRDIVEFLLKQRANPFLPVMPTAKLPLTAIDLAKEDGDTELVELFSKYMD